MTEADVMERARQFYHQWSINWKTANAPTNIAWLARALTDYGDQRAREARAAAIEEAACAAEKHARAVGTYLTAKGVGDVIRALTDTPSQSEEGEG